MAINQMYYEIVNNEDGTTTLYYGANEWVGATLKEVGSSDNLFKAGNSLSRISPKDDSIVELENYKGSIIYKYDDSTSNASGLYFDLTHILIKSGSFRLITNSVGSENVNYITIKELGLPSGIELAYRPWTVDCCVENRIFSRDYPDNYIPDMLNVAEEYTMRQSKINGLPNLFNFGSGIDSVSIGYFPFMIIGNSSNSNPGHLLNCSCSKVEFRTDVYWPVNSGFLCYYVSNENNIDLSKVHIKGNATNHPVDNDYYWGNPKNLITSNALQVERLYMPNCQGLNFVRRSNLNTYSIINDKCLSAELGGLENTTNIECLFNGCSFLESVKLGGINNLLNAHSAFYNCTSLKKIEASIKLNESASGSEIFYNCTKLVGGNGTLFNSSNIGIEMLKVDREGTPGYLTYNKSTDYYGIYLPLSIRKSISVNYPYTQFSKGANVNVLFTGFSKDITLDYWLQYDPTTKRYKNIGSRNPLTFEILDNVYLIPVLKKGASASTYSVDLSSVPSNSCTLTGAGAYTAGDNVVITASPNEGYVFKQWEELINETWIILSYDKEYTLHSIGRDRTIRAVCVEETSDEVVEITLSITGGNGVALGSGKYVKGTEATIKAIAGSKYKFKSWNLPGQVFVVSTQNPYTFTVVKSIEYQAVFVDNPYEGGGTTGEGGGNGEFTDYIDVSPVPPLNLSATNTDLLSIYTLDINGVNQLAKFIYADIFDGTYTEKLESILKLFGDIMDQIVSFGILPFTVPGTPSATMPYLDIAAPVNCKIPTSQYITINCGTRKIGNYWNNFLDYSPYTKYELYLPFIGYKDLDADEIVNKDLNIKYRIDILTGDLICYISLDGNVRYQYGGNCLISLPLNSSTRDTGSVISGVASLTTAVGGLLLGNPAVSTAGITGSAVNLITEKQSIKHGSSLSSSANYLGLLYPVLYITRPRQNVPADYGKIKGYPSNITTKLKNLKGYTVIDEIHLENMSATDDEIEEIETLLKQGVIIN